MKYNLSPNVILTVFGLLSALFKPVFAQDSNGFLSGVTSSGEECTCEIPDGTPNLESSLVINRPDCDPNDFEKCQANCANIHGVDTYLSDKCCAYAGQSASVLAFEEDSKWIPILEEFNRCTGALVRLEYLQEGEDGMAAALVTDVGDDISHDNGIPAGQGIFDAYIVQAPWLWEVVNGLEDLSPLIRQNADTVKFLDINSASRAAVSYNGTIRALPLDTDYVALGWRQDVFHKYNIPPELSPPRSIQDLATVAQQLHGLDFNGDGEGDWGICVTPQVNYFYAFVAPLMQTALYDPKTGTHTGQNLFFSVDTFEPLIRQPAFREAVELYWTILRNSNCQEQLAKGEACDRRSAFSTGRCAMVISMPGTLTDMLTNGGRFAPAPRINEVTGEVLWDINNETLGEGGNYWGRRAPFPGSTIVQDWNAEDAGYPLVGCSTNKDKCPHGEGGINFAPFFAEGGEAYAINGRQSKPIARRIMWDLFTWLSELPETVIPLSGQYRKSHLSDENRATLQEDAGWPEQMVDDLFALLGRYFLSEEEGGNPVQDLLMLGFSDYMNALDEELHDKFLGVTKDSMGGLWNLADPADSIDPIRDSKAFEEAFSQFIDSLELRYNAISDSISGGRMAQLQRWRQALDLQWRTEEEICSLALSESVDAFEGLKCPSIVDFSILCQTKADKVALYDDELCGTIYGNGSDNMLAVLVPSILIPFLLALIIAYVVVERRKRRTDSLWEIKQSELHFSDPPTVIGSGSFGQVLLAEYRGTQVAVKRTIPPKGGSSDDGQQEEEKEVKAGMDSWAMLSTGHFGMKSTKQKVAFNQDIEEQAPPSKTTGMHNKGAKTTIFGRQNDSNTLLKANFIAEMHQLSNLRHPCITTLMGAVIEKGVEPQLVMEYCEHGSLYDMIHNETVPLEGDVLHPILQDLCQGIRFLHAATPQVIHGDLKTANILIDSRFRAKIADFGLSSKQSMGATGSPYWMAPELLRGESVNTAATDVYSFGIVLSEVYSRKDPYEGEDFHEILTQIVDPKVNKRPPIPESCPKAMVTIMTECLDADANSRPTFEELDLRLKRLGVESIDPYDSPSAVFGRKKREGKALNLLDNVFPPHIAEALREGRQVEQEHHDCVTIFFSDIVGFTTISAEIGPQKVASLLDRVYTRFDDLTHKWDIFKVETVGDAYMAITNLVRDQKDDHAKRIAQFAMDAIKACQETLIDEDDPTKGHVQIRVGFHSGPVLSGVVGTRLPKFGVFGDTVNTASRMESNSSAGRINCSEAAATLLKKQAPEMTLISRGRITIKGKAEMTTYWVFNRQQDDVESGVETVALHEMSA